MLQIATKFGEWLSQSPPENSVFQYGGRTYTYLTCIGQGGFGKAFHVVPQHGPEMVFKICNARNARELDASIRKEFGRALKLKSNPRCARMGELLYDEQNVVGFSYEFVEGVTLDELIADSETKPNSQEIKRLALELFIAVKDLYEEGWIHKDIKPGNIVVRPDSQEITLIDFGLLTTGDSSTTRHGWGTPEYQAPEARDPQFREDFHLDLYGACASMLALILGHAAYESCFTRDQILLAWKFRELAPADLASLDPLSRNLARHFAKGLNVSRAARPRDADAHIEFLLQVDDRPENKGPEVKSEAVAGLLDLRKGRGGVLPPEGGFGKLTQIDTRLDRTLLPQLIRGEIDALFLSGNPGDGKTTFLKDFQNVLKTDLEAEVLAESSKEWTIRYKMRTYHAILDASESDGAISSDERIANALSRLAENNNVVLVAINDGRIDSFMRAHSDQFDFAADVQRQIRGAPPANSRIRVVDLKRRSLIRPGNDEESPGNSGRGIGTEILLKLTDKSLWSSCQECASREVCPILDNKIRLGRDRALEGIERLLSISHYRREQRATFRDIRSVFAYMITGDRSCDDVHRARREGRDLRRAPNTAFYDLVFNGHASDLLLLSWQTLDPARLPLAEAARLVGAHAIGEREHLRDKAVASFAREAFFGGDENQVGRIDPSEWSMYRHLDSYRKLVSGQGRHLLPRILNGLSLILGSSGSRGDMLSVAMNERFGSWVVQRDFPIDNFDLVVDTVDKGSYVEESIDSIRLAYQNPVKNQSPIELRLLLDDIEVILRADDGEIFGDLYSREIIAKFSGYAARLRLLESESLTIVAPAGERYHARRSGAVIEMTRE
jgi:serine/threonine protein kinase